MLEKQEKRKRRHKKIRTEIRGTAEIPRLCVFKSLNHIYAQIINDETARTLVSVGDEEISQKTSSKNKKHSGKSEKAYQVGKLTAKKAAEKKIKKIVFDRAGYKYHGRIKALAEGAREGGLQF